MKLGICFAVHNAAWKVNHYLLLEMKPLAALRIGTMTFPPLSKTEDYYMQTWACSQAETT